MPERFPGWLLLRRHFIVALPIEINGYSVVEETLAEADITPVFEPSAGRTFFFVLADLGQLGTECCVSPA